MVEVTDELILHFTQFMEGVVNDQPLIENLRKNCPDGMSQRVITGISAYVGDGFGENVSPVNETVIRQITERQDSIGDRDAR